ncbi:MAG: hypothetical protein NTY19_43635 [Planctomycetota bacterium]|nr:hypothetical protein [Planctomycetota bacterium]
MRIERGFTAVHAETLRTQTFDDFSPGPILHDFQVMLGHIGTDGVKAAGQYNLLPLDAIPVLDERLARPLRLQMKRPQLRSHPYLQGLHLLLRASGITCVQGSGAKTRLVLEPAALERWQSLSPTERYFALLESWLLIGQAEMLGERGSRWDGFLMQCLHEWQLIPAGGRSFGKWSGRPDMLYLRGLGRQFYLLVLMDLFGLIQMQHAPVPPQPWAPAGFSRTPFGDAVFTLLADQHYRIMFARHGESGDDDEEADAWEAPGTSDERPTATGVLMDEPRERSSAEAGGRPDPEHADETADGEPEDTDRLINPPDETAGFGYWQPLFQPYVPAWQHTLAAPPPPARTGIFVFRVSVGGARRDIAMPDDATVHDLVECILDSINFDDEHLYELTYRDHLGRTLKACHPAIEEGPWADEIRIGELPLAPGASMKLLYDFGDHWEFAIRLERIEEGRGKKRASRVIARQGRAPKQHDSWNSW